VAGAVTYASTTVNNFSSYATYIYPWVKITSPIDGSKVSAPACGFWMGIIARTDATRGIWTAPAGIVDGAVRGIVGVETGVTDVDYDLLYPAKINAIQVFEGEGTAVMGNITLDVTGEFGELNVRRLFLYVEQSLKIGLRWVNFEPNNETTRARVTRNVRSFLIGIWKAEGLDGIKADDAFFVQCDEENNDPVTRQQRKLKCRVGLAPVHAAEFVDVTVEQDTRAIDAAIAAAA
jgi:phage tail sheath protein FI